MIKRMDGLSKLKSILIFLLMIFWGSSCESDFTFEFVRDAPPREVNGLTSGKPSGGEIRNHLSSDERKRIIEFLYQTSQTEIAATNQLDIEIIKLEGLHSKDILALIEETINENRAFKDKREIEFDSDRSYYLGMWFSDSSTIMVEGCEYWRTLSFDDRGNQIGNDDWTLISQTITIKVIENSFQLFDSSGDKTFCKESVERNENDSSMLEDFVVYPTSTPYILVGATGQVTWKKWDISWPLGIVTLRESPYYPDYAEESSLLNTFEALQGNGDTFGQRISGYVYPPVTGIYTFWVAGDEFSELWLSSSPDPAEKVLIASAPGFTAFREWDRYASQQSAEISLQAGKAYYIEALGVNGAGDDHLSVAWEVPNQPRSIIDGQYLEPAP